MLSGRMQLFVAAALLCVCAAGVRAQSAGKWSRQLEPSVAGAGGVSDSFDWIPLAQPVDTSVGSAGDNGAAAALSKDRSANGRVLTYSQTFPPDAHFGSLPSAAKSHFPPPQQQQHLQHQHQPQTFDFPYQYQRFLNAPPQTQSLRGGSGGGPLKAPQEPTSQSFFKFEMPLHGEANGQISGAPSVQTGYQIQHSFGGGAQAALFNQALFGQQPIFPPEFHPLPQKSLAPTLDQQKPLPQQNFIDSSLPLKNSFRETKPHPTQQAQQALQAVAPQVFPVEPPVEPVFELNKPASFQNQPAFQQTGPAPTASAGSAPGVSQQQQQDVQLLYVPYDTLYNQQQQQQQQGIATASPPSYDVNKYNVNPGLPAVNPYQINQFYTPDPVLQPESNFYTTSTTSRPYTTSLKPADQYQTFVSSSQPQFTTAKPKPKAHQPPLAMFMLRSSARPTQSDVVDNLHNANSIAVIDAPTKQTPNIFVGPAGMPVPEGYIKFDLPYLSQLSQKRDLREVPFFVAPLSYRTPNGFNKILLPEPHVGSIVVNRANDFGSSARLAVPTQSIDIAQYSPTTTVPRTRPTLQQQQQRLKPNPVSNGKDYYSSDVTRQPTQKLRDPFEITTQRATLQTNRGNKFNYYYDQDQAIHEVTSPKVSKLDRPKKKRPQTVQIEQYPPQQHHNLNSNLYDHFKPTSNQISTEDYFKVQQTKPTTSSTSTSTSSTSTTTSTTSTTAAPQTYFTYNTSPQVEFQSTKGQLYPNLNAAPQITADEHLPRFTTRPPVPVLSPEEEEYRMKQYFRQQNAFRNRPQLVQSTLSPYEQVQYTPVAYDFDHDVKIPSSTTQKATTSTAKQRITFYTPTPTPVTVTTLEQQQINTVTPQYSDEVIPANHRPAFNQNEISDDITEYEPNPYQLPSELPPLAPNLPGLVNGLQEKDKQNALGFETSTASSTTLEPELPTRPSRRPLNRVRKPIVSKITSSVSYSESESTSRRPVQRVRRPLPSRGYSSDTDADSTTTSTTRRPTSSRTAIIRNPNRIRYQPTTEERQSLRLKTRKYTSGSKKATASEDLEYQRDVLKQNYPVFKPSGRKGTSPTAIPSSYSSSIGTEVPTSESQQVYTVTPSNSIDNDPDRFPASLLEPMQIAEQYNEYSKDNYGPGYFPNQEDLAPTEPALRNEINPFGTMQSTTISTTTTTTTTTPAPTVEDPAITTRRSPFVRRNYPRLRTTTTESPTTTPVPEEKSSIRPRIPPRKVIKVRQRTRRPYQPASSTTSTPDEEQEQEEQEQRQTFRKVNRYNQDLYENDSARRRLKNKSHFQLEGQESQWSPALKTANSHNFKPFNPKDKRNKDEPKPENEPEIVTAGPTIETQEDNTNYEINVSANLGSSAVDASQKTVIKAPNLKPEKSFAELLEEVMGKAPEEEPLDTPDTDTRTTDGTFFESHKTTVGDRFNRRGKWKKLRTGASTTPSGESFETAESQNLGSQLLNSLYGGANKDAKTAEEIIRDLRTTTPLTPTEKISSTTTTNLPFFFTTTPTPQSTIDDYDMTTSRHMEMTTQPTSIPMEEIVSTTAANVQSDDATEEMATRRHDEAYDDLDTQSSLFSEVKKQLHDLFAIEENENENEQAVTAALAAVGRRRQEYTNIKRAKTDSTTTESDNDASLPATEATSNESDKKSPFHKNLMDHVVYATSTSTKVTSETEICYRGRCVRSEDLPPNHKLN